jgi:Na+:H+ antiporter, NhaA family
MKKLINQFFQQFIRIETASGILLGLATLLALFFNNSALKPFYQNLLQTVFPLGPAHWHWHSNGLHFINEGLMVVFFLLVSLEIKREFLEGQLKSRKYALLPLLAALGGVLIPAVCYLFFNINQPFARQGWAIPTATDIAFSLGVLSLFATRIPLALKLFLTTLAVIDDLIAILVIAFFYTPSLQWGWLGIALLLVAYLGGLNQARINYLACYLIGGLLLWFCILKSGIHATVSGVLLGFMIPLRVRDSNTQFSLLHRLEQCLHPWVAYGILPVFAFANAGLDLSGISWTAMNHPLFLGIFTGLLVGKPLGILGASWVAVRMGLARIPATLKWSHISGAALLGGIGFTMSLFIGILAFENDNASLSLVRLGVLSGSVMAALLAGVLLTRIEAHRISK